MTFSLPLIKDCVYLVLLDLSAAFDTIDHQVFLTQLQRDYGMSGGIVEWMKLILLVGGNVFRLMEYPLMRLHYNMAFLRDPV